MNEKGEEALEKTIYCSQSISQLSLGRPHYSNSTEITGNFSEKLPKLWWTKGKYYCIVITDCEQVVFWVVVNAESEDYHRMCFDVMGM